MKFDLIGFDACLMQDIEIARAFEPYADYYLGSEETEGGFGWYYTSAFGKLASDPGMDTEEFGKDIVSAYDQFNTILNDGNTNTGATLSLVDLTRVKPAYTQLVSLLETADEAIRKDPDEFGEIGLAAMNAYQFTDSIQIDLVDFLEKLGDADINDSICTQEERDEVINAIKACILYRNRDSAKGINGMSLGLPYKKIDFYQDTAIELDNLKLRKEREVFNDIFSIIAVQKKAEHERKMQEESSRLGRFLEEISYEDFTQKSWYVKGFEDYDPTTTLIDIPLTDTGEGYSVQLPDKTWNIIADCVTLVYQKAEDGRMRYLGYDHTGDLDKDGHPMVDMDDRWVHINGQLVCYEDSGAMETEEGIIYTGDVKARLNGSEDIKIHVEWDASDSEDGAETGCVTGYDFEDDAFSFMERGSEKFNTGDKIEFLFDYYDEEGNLVSTEPYGKSIRVTTMDRLKVEDAPLEDCDIQFYGVLTDAYQRNLITEGIEAHIGD